MIIFWGFYMGENPNLWQPMMSPVLAGYDGYNELVDNCNAATVYDDAQRWAAEAVHTVIDEARTSISLFGIYLSWATSDRVVEFPAHPEGGLVSWNDTVLAD
jgi:hypothetical protein